MSEEQWETIEQFPKYEVSSLGRVRTKRLLRPLEGFVKPNGSIQVTVYGERGSTARLVHVLVAEAFLGILPGEDYQIEWSDGDKSNNSVENLRVVYAPLRGRRRGRLVKKRDRTPFWR